MEGTRTPLHHHDLLSPVPSPTTHEVTPVHTYARVVALAAVRALDAQLGVALAEHGRGLEVHEVLHPWRLVLRVVRLQLEVVLALAAPLVAQTARVAHHHPGGTVEAVLEVVAHHAEAGEPHPAGLHCAGPRHAVALALLTHFGRHVLQHNNTNMFTYTIIQLHIKRTPQPN